MTDSSNILPFVPRNWRHERAFAEAGRRDAIWYRNNPGRLYRARRSLPYEFPKWGAVEHEHWNWTLVRLDPAASWCDRMPVHAFDGGMVDDELFLATVWHLSQAGSGPLDLSPEFHAALLEGRGYEVNRG